MHIDINALVLVFTKTELSNVPTISKSELNERIIELRSKGYLNIVKHLSNRSRGIVATPSYTLVDMSEFPFETLNDPLLATNDPDAFNVLHKLTHTRFSHIVAVCEEGGKVVDSEGHNKMSFIDSLVETTCPPSDVQSFLDSLHGSQWTIEVLSSGVVSTTVDMVLSFTTSIGVQVAHAFTHAYWGNPSDTADWKRAYLAHMGMKLCADAHAV